MYKCSPSYVAHAVTNFSLQFMIYETLTDQLRDRLGEEEASRKKWIFQKAITAGSVGAALTNALEVISVKQQSCDKLSVIDIIK